MECLCNDPTATQGKENSSRNNQPVELLDEEVEEKINENTMKGDLVVRALQKEIKNEGSFEMARKIIKATTAPE